MSINLSKISERAIFIQYPQTYQQGFTKGHKGQKKLASRRGDGTNEVTTLEEIYVQNKDVLNWWTRDL